MPVIPFVSPKGGCGKSTSAVLLASYLAESGHSVTIIDADPNRPVSRWSKRPGKPKNLSVLENVTEEIRAVVHAVWPEFISKLPPKS